MHESKKIIVPPAAKLYQLIKRNNKNSYFYLTPSSKLTLNFAAHFYCPLRFMSGRKEIGYEHKAGFESFYDGNIGITGIVDFGCPMSIKY